MRLLICDADEQFCDAARRHFSGQEHVEVTHGRLEDLPGDVDCVVWPGNCQALPASRLDAALAALLGAATLEHARARILDEFGDDGCPIGTTFLLPTAASSRASQADSRPPPCAAFVAVFPRCREGPGLAMRGVLEAVARYNDAALAEASAAAAVPMAGGRSKVGGSSASAAAPREELSIGHVLGLSLGGGGLPELAPISCVACPGLGTFTGSPDADEVAAGMAAAAARVGAIGHAQETGARGSSVGAGGAVGSVSACRSTPPAASSGGGALG
eukprot:CAMPEP_0183415732 /NCGR_PEP_ID=MMETSP0370-20130417/23303_1 /TAXON_ID=268820 /ORGANISM="Peridinium aciculiferum, Strain PAER-2" /LENGTH=272 /DNA_ID=CAMNT_0025599191 /DNA_START=27 /DNA_END=841 /DNA_ORIENTATION=-